MPRIRALALSLALGGSGLLGACATTTPLAPVEPPKTTRESLNCPDRQAVVGVDITRVDGRVTDVKLMCAPAHAPRAAIPPRAADARVPPKTDYESWVRETGDDSYELEGKKVDEALADLTVLSRQARVIPNYRGGKYQGFKLVGVRPGSLYRALGFRSGDIIMEVDGAPIDSPNRALEMYERMSKADRLEVTVERRGQRHTLRYHIRR